MERKEFSKYLSEIYNYGTLMSAIGLGYELGLFQVFYEPDQEPLSLQDIATKANLKERYIKEWLSCMVTAEILQQDRVTGLYTMPKGHKEELKIRASYAPILTVMGKRTDLVKDCFRKDGPKGFGFGMDKQFFNWRVNYMHDATDTVLDESIIPTLNQQGVVSKLESGIKVLDVGCGEASFTIGFAKRFPNSQFTGIELDDYAVKIATENASNLPNLNILTADAENLRHAWTGHFDWVFIRDVIHDLPRPHTVLKEIYKVLKNDGSLTLIDTSFHSNALDNIGNKTAAMYYSLSMFVCLPASMEAEPHVGYGACWGIEEMDKALKEAKFNVSSLTNGAYVYFYCTK